MAFTGFSSDEEGSIVFDGKKFIVNNPKKVPENFGPGDKPVIGLPEDHPGHPNNRKRPPRTIPPRLYAPPPATAQPPQRESTSEMTRPSQTVRLGEQILRRNEERAEQDAAAQSPEPSLSGFPQDIEWSPYLDASGLVTAVSAGNVKPDIGQDGAQVFCEALYEASPEGVASTLRILHGTEPDDEEQSPVEELVKLVRSAGFVEHFENEPWYTTRLGPTAEDTDFLTQTPDGTTHSVTDADERWYRFSEGDLHPYIQHALTGTFSSKWSEKWTKPEDLEGFLKGRLTPFLIKNYIDALPWDELTDLGMINMYHSLLETLWNEHWNTDSARDPWVSSLDDEFTDADDLLSVVAAVPLVNEARLLEEFDYAGVEEARGDLLDQVQYAYEKFDIRPPEDLHEWSALQLANELYSLLTGVFEPYAEDRSNTEYYQKAYDFVTDPDFVTIVGKAPSTTIDRLDGSQQESPLKLVFFVASFFIEPLDWYLTAQEMVSAAEDEDWWQVVLSGITGIAPGAFGRFVKRGNADEVLSTVQLTRRSKAVNGFSEPFQRPGSAYVMGVDNYVSRSVSGYTSRNAGLLKTQMEKAAKVDDSFAWRLKTHSDQQMHHIVPTGRWKGDEARRILSAQGVYVNSAYNGIALDKPIHRLTNSDKYTEAVSKVIVRLKNASPEIIAMFLEETAKRLQALNIYPKGDLLTAKFQTEIMDWLTNYLG